MIKAITGYKAECLSMESLVRKELKNSHKAIEREIPKNMASIE